MKYFTIGALWVALGWNVSAQKTAGPAAYPAQLTGNGQDKAIPDTLFHNFFNLDPVLYPAPVGGWMSGTNTYMDLEKGQEIKFEQTYFITGLIYWFAIKDKNTGGDTSSVIYKLYSKDAVQSVNGLNRLVPGTVLASDTVKLSDVNAGITFAAGLNLFMLPQPRVIYQNYIGAFSMQLMNPKDTVALYNSTDGQVAVTDYSWEKAGTGWNTIKNAWSLDVDFAVFPVIDLTGASVSEQEGLSVRISPNPAREWINVEMPQAAYREYVVLNATGQTVLNGTTSADRFQVDVQTFAPGYYVLGVYSEGGKNARFFRFLKQ